MRFDEMMNQINTAIASERQTQDLRRRLAQLAQLRGGHPSTEDLDSAVQFVIDYIKHVPILLLAMHAAAKNLGAERSIEPLLAAGEQYWDAGMDLIPDHLGLVGFTDDAYYVLTIIQAIAEQHRQADGVPLMKLNLTQMNQIMRNLIGEPAATVLDTAIAGVLVAPAFQALLRNIPMLGQSLVDRDPVWGNATIDEIVDARMGALGIV